MKQTGTPCCDALGRPAPESQAAAQQGYDAAKAENARLVARWSYIKADIEGARALLLLLKHGKGTSDDFDTMVDRIIESRRAALSAKGTPT